MARRNLFGGRRRTAGGGAAGAVILVGILAGLFGHWGTDGAARGPAIAPAAPRQTLAPAPLAVEEPVAALAAADNGTAAAPEASAEALTPTTVPAPAPALAEDVRARAYTPPGVAADHRGPVHVREYTKKDGTHVRAHTRSAPKR